jgi:hypothetical protein
MTLQQNSVSFMTIATIVLVTSIFSLKGLSGTMGALKAEEPALFHKSNLSRSTMYKPKKRIDREKRADFVICNECFWCASQIREKDDLTACPGCKESNLETMPVSLNEAHLFGREQGT